MTLPIFGSERAPDIRGAGSVIELDVVPLSSTRLDLLALFGLDRLPERRLACRWRREIDGRISCYWEPDIVSASSR